MPFMIGDFYLMFLGISIFIHREIVAKNILLTSTLLSILEEWVNKNFALCMLTAPQIANFPRSHLMAEGWYLDYSSGFVPIEEKPLYDIIVSGAPDEVVHVELDIEEIKPPPPPFNVKVSPTPKGKAKNPAKPSTIHMTTRFATKASTPYTSVVGNPSISPSVAPCATLPLTLSTMPLGLVFAPSQSDVFTLHVSRKRKAVAPDTFATSSGMPFSYSLIENVDMGEFIEDLMKTKVPPLAYRRIQEFLTKVYILFFCFLHSFHRIQYFIFHLYFS